MKAAQNSAVLLAGKLKKPPPQFKDRFALREDYTCIGLGLEAGFEKDVPFHVW